MGDLESVAADEGPAKALGPEFVTAAQMRGMEQEAIAAGLVSGLELMERAGQGVVDQIRAMWTGMDRALVLCGPGNNGGDGFVVARLLAELGWEVQVFECGDAAGLPPDAAANRDRWNGPLAPISAFEPALWPALSQDEDGFRTLIVDALFGTGLSRPITGDLARQIAALAAMQLGSRPAVVAVDLPSGICSDSGRVLGVAMPAEQIVTFHRPKLGHVLDAGGLGALAVNVVPIGLPERWSFHRVASVGANMPLIVGGLMKSNRAGAHKFSYGHAVVVSGPAGACGAARMTARSALRVGAGLVTLACPPEAMAENAARLDAVMVRALAGEAALTALLSDARINALCIGPGLGLDARAAGLVREALISSRSREIAKVGPKTAKGLGQGAESRGAPRATGDAAAPGDLPGAVREDHAPYRRLVLDADALTLIARDPALFALLHDGCVLTPHGGEFARLFPDLAAKLAAPATKGPAYSKVDATREAAARAGCTVLFKGPDTVIASPLGTCALHASLYDREAPWLATAGSGDVLAGLITGLLARGFAPQEAAETGAWLHTEAARAFGPGLIAEDLPDMIPRVFRNLGL